MQTAEARFGEVRAQRKLRPRKVIIDSLPADQRLIAVLPLSEMFADTVRMIAYRAETAMVALLKRHLAKEADALALVRELHVSDADIERNEFAWMLTIRIHRMANPSDDKAVAARLHDASTWTASASQKPARR